LRKKTHEQYVQELKDKERKAFPLEKYKTAKEPILHKCYCGNTWMSSPQAVLYGYGCGCKQFRKPFKTHEQYLKQLKDRNSGVVPKGTYVDAKTKIDHICVCGKVFFVTPNDVLAGLYCGCKRQGMNRKDHNHYLKLLTRKEIKVKPLEEYIDQDTKILHRCFCGTVFKCRPNNVLAGSSCGCQMRPIRLDTDGYIKKLKEKNIKAMPVEDFKGVKVPIKHKCICGTVWKVSPDNVYRGKKCGCEISRGEEAIRKYLAEKNYEYATQQTFKGFRSPKGGLFKYDVSILENDRVIALIEYHGEQHFRYSSFFHNESLEQFHYRQLCDQIKRDYAKKIGIPLIEIHYKKDTIPTLEAELQKLGIGQNVEQLVLF